MEAQGGLRGAKSRTVERKPIEESLEVEGLAAVRMLADDSHEGLTVAVEHGHYVLGQGSQAVGRAGLTPPGGGSVTSRNSRAANM